MRKKEFDLAIRHNPRDYEAYLHRSRLRRQNDAHNHIGELKGLLDATELPWRGRMVLLYAIGKEHEDLGDYDSSFEALREGAGLRRAHMQYDVGKRRCDHECRSPSLSCRRGWDGTRGP